MPYFDIKLTSVSEGHIIKDTGRVVITDNPDPLPPPSPENLMVWDCVYFDNTGTRNLNYEFKRDHEYAVCVLDSYGSNELIWAYFPFTEHEENQTLPLHFSGLDDFALYRNGRLYIDSESDRSSKIYRLLERPMRTLNSEGERTNPGEWLDEDINMGFDWQSDREYYIIARDTDGIFAGHIFTHHTWHGNIRRLDPTKLYVSAYRHDHSNRWVIFHGKRGVNSGGSSSEKYLTHKGRQTVLKAYSRPFDISTSESDIDANSNTWLHKITLNKQDNGFSVTNFNWQENNMYLTMGLDTEGDWEIGAKYVMIDDKIEDITAYNKTKGIGNVVGESLWSRFVVDGSLKKVRAESGRLVSIYQRPLLLSDETCGSSSTAPVNNDGNWIINQLPINSYETTENVSGTPVSYITNCGITLHLNKGLNANNVVDDIDGSILISVLDRIDDTLQQGTNLGVLQVAQFDWQSGSSAVLNVERKQLVGELETVPNSNSISHDLSNPLTLAVDDFDEGVVQFNITATITQADGDVLEFGVMQVLINKTSDKDSANDYLRPDEQLF
jgi:hypothetical protein